MLVAKFFFVEKNCEKKLKAWSNKLQHAHTGERDKLR